MSIAGERIRRAAQTVSDFIDAWHCFRESRDVIPHDLNV